MTDRLSEERLREMLAGAAKATPGPWAVKAESSDDWGWVRGGPPDEDGRMWTVAQARAGRFVDRNEFQQHRNNSTDPYGDNAVHIAACDPQTITSLITELLELRSEASRVPEWQDISTAPKDGTPVLVWWPIVAVDDSGDLTSEQVGGRALVTQWDQGSWLEPEVLSGLNSNYFGDDCEYAEYPTHWMPLPASPDTQTQENEA